MDCPVCKNAMITMELAEVEIDYCAGCGGIWLDAGELETLLGNGGKSKQLIKSFEVDKASTEKRRKCPICDKKMEKIIVGRSQPSVLIDRCPKGDGLWFDKGELQNIIDRAQLDKDNKIRNLLADMFGGQQSR
jgi:Zn-finger nucleic acid-binding protein